MMDTHPVPCVLVMEPWEEVYDALCCFRTPIF